MQIILYREKITEYIEYTFNDELLLNKFKHNLMISLF